MKKYFYLLLLLSGFVNAQIVNIPDANFKSLLLASSPNFAVAKDALGNPIVIDVNGDSEIQVSEALLVYQLFINSSQITQLTGLENFTNITYFDCSNTSLFTLNVTALTNLVTLKCDSAELTSLNVSGLTNLKNLFCMTNQLTSLNLSNLTNLEVVFCYSNMLSTININGASSLYQLNCENNLLTNLDLLGYTNLTHLYAQNNQISSLSLSGLSSLHNVYIGNNQMSSLEIINCPLIEQAGFNNNLLSTISIVGSTAIESLIINNNSFTDVSFVTSIPGLKGLNCSNNLISDLSFVGSIPNLQTLLCSNTLIATLDVSNNANFASLQCTNNPNLTSVFLKFGRENTLTIQGGYPLNNNPNLQYVCVDEYRIDTFSNYFIQNNMPNVVVNSYCSFTPGGDYNTITGAMIFDSNNNGCDALDLPQPNIKININDGTEQGSTFTNNSGNYNFYTQAGSFTLTPNVENPTWFNFSPATATIPFGNSNNNTTTQNFCITANGVHPDLEIVIAPFVPARPGFDAVYQIVYKNKGNQTLSQLYGVNFFFNQNLMDFVSATTTPSTVGPGSLSWSYSNLPPFESRSIYVTVNINTPTDTTNPVNIGDILQFTTSILPMAGDESTVDNTFLFDQTVVGSFDPNNIICMEGNVVAPSEIGDYLHYVINFENTGTSEAENIVVQTEVNVNDFDINSLQMLATSHNAYIKVVNNQIEFIFQNIMLDTGGHGNVLLKIRSKSNLVTGDIVSKKADIFFDYNFPIDTGMANTTFQALSTGEFVTDNSINIYPNPAVNFVTINSDSNINSIQLYDVQGRLLQTKIENQTEVTFDVSNQSSGIYFFKIQSDNGVKVVKLIKE